MLTFEIAQKSAREGIRRARCVPVEIKTSNDDLHVTVKAPDAIIAHIGCVTNWRQSNEYDISEKIRRFSEHYCLNRPYHLHWGDSLV